MKTTVDRWMRESMADAARQWDQECGRRSWERYLREYAPHLAALPPAERAVREDMPAVRQRWCQEVRAQCVASWALAAGLTQGVLTPAQVIAWEHARHSGRAA